MVNTIKEQELRKRIDNLSVRQIFDMSYDSLRLLTSDFNESLFKKVVSKGESLDTQMEILDCIKDALKDFQRRYYKNQYPEWLYNALDFAKMLRLDLDCGIPITDDPAPDDFEKKMDAYLESHEMTEEDIDQAIAKAEGNTGVESNSDEVVVLKARIKELEAENEQLKRIKELENIVTSSEGGEVETKPDWIDWFDDDVFKPNFNAEKIAEAIKVIVAPHLSTHCYWYVVFRVLDKIRWLADGVTQKAFLKWANAHFSYGWKGEQQFKFSEINDSIKKVADIDDWDEYTMKTNQGQYYAELRDKLYKVFVEKLPNGKLFDRTEFIKQGQQRVNNGH